MVCPFCQSTEMLVESDENTIQRIKSDTYKEAEGNNLNKSRRYSKCNALRRKSGSSWDRLPANQRWYTLLLRPFPDPEHGHGSPDPHGR